MNEERNRPLEDAMVGVLTNAAAAEIGASRQKKERANPHDEMVLLLGIIAIRLGAIEQSLAPAPSAFGPDGVLKQARN